MSAALSRSFDSLAVPNYRRYFTGQLFSLSGNWMQNVAEIWLILGLTSSGLAVGLTTAFQFLPFLLFSAAGGLLADRVGKRRLLMITQPLQVIPVLALFAVSTAGIAQVWMVWVAVFGRGLVNSVDHPTRQAFVSEMVGAERVVNAISLNSVIVHSSRIVGPALAGVLIATVGVAPCFALNALSFGVMAIALASMDPGALEAPPLVARERGGVRAGIAYVRGEPRLMIALGLMAIVGTFGLNFQVIIPLLARFTYGGGATTYAALVCAMGVGSVIGALTTGARGTTSPGVIAKASLAFGILSALAALVPTVMEPGTGLLNPSLLAELAVLACLGGFAVTFAASVNSYLQLAVAPQMRGRVMALYAVVFLGSTPIGGPIAGLLSGAFDPRAALLLAASSGVSAAWAARVAFARLERRERDAARLLEPRVVA